MATVRSSLSHEERTAQQPRVDDIQQVVLSRIERVNESIRLLRLSAPDPNHIKFLPGQWLDVFIPGMRKAGGFTITSTPAEARPTTERPAYFELAIQRSENPPAKWLWRPETEILGSQLFVRAGGSFTWPPPQIPLSSIDQVVFVAGGVGINPDRPKRIRFLYASKVESTPVRPESILFLPRLMELSKPGQGSDVHLEMYLTGVPDDEIAKVPGLSEIVSARRLNGRDLLAALPKTEDRGGTVCFVCGPPRMTDSIVDFLKSQEGMDERRVLCEKWW